VQRGGQRLGMVRMHSSSVAVVTQFETHQSSLRYAACDILFLTIIITNRQRRSFHHWHGREASLSRSIDG
jgi:hypothetical protein